MGSDPMAKKFFRVTLSPRGVCSRIPHLGVSSTPTHGQISTHVYVPYIIPFLRHPRHNHVNLASIQPPSQSPSFHQPRHTIQSQSSPRLLHALHAIIIALCGVRGAPALPCGALGDRALPCGRRWNAVPSVRRGIRLRRRRQVARRAQRGALRSKVARGRATDPLQFTICMLQANFSIL